MSTRPSDDSRAPLHDPAFDAAWRAVSSEMPPPAADAAILAAARRAVDTGPRRVAEATRPERWWAPLAAAATIGAIAIGILQLAAPDKTAAPPVIVSDMPVAPAQAPKVDALAAPDRQRTARPDAEVEAPAPAKDARKPIGCGTARGKQRECNPGDIAHQPSSAPPVRAATPHRHHPHRQHPQRQHPRRQPQRRAHRYRRHRTRPSRNHPPPPNRRRPASAR